MRREIVSDIAFWCVAALGATMLVVLLGVVSGAIPVASSTTEENEAAAASTATPGGTTASPATTTAAREPAKAPERTISAETVTQPKPTPAPPAEAIIVVTAARGDSWFSARLGSEEGRVLDERVLAQGESVRLEGPRIWLSVGAAGNVDLTVNGKPRSISPGTVELVLTRPAPAAS